MERYLTLLSTAYGEYEEKRSRFIAEVRKVTSEEEATAFVKEQKAKYWDARHNVYAYVLSSGECRFSDDGEPHGTAGKPVLDIINGRALKDVCVVVTRYFGGVLLGTGGLVRAYSEAVKDALANAEIGEMRLLILCKIQCEYSLYNTLNAFIENNKGCVTDTVFEDKITLSLTVDESDFENFSLKLIDTFSGRLAIERAGEIYSAVKI